MTKKKTGLGAITISKARASVNEELAQELYKTVIKKFRRRRVYSRFKDNICVANLAKMGPLSSKNWGVKYLLCVIDASTKYAWTKTFKNKNAKIVLHGFIEIVSESKCKANKLWVDQGREFYNSFMLIWLDDNDILMYSTHNEGKSIVDEKFIRILKAKIYKKVAAKSYHCYLNKFVNEYNNSYHHSIGKKPIDADYSALTEKNWIKS